MRDPLDFLERSLFYMVFIKDLIKESTANRLGIGDLLDFLEFIDAFI